MLFFFTSLNYVTLDAYFVADVILDQIILR